MSVRAKGITVLLVLFIGIGGIGLMLGYPYFFIEQTSAFETDDVQSIQLTMHSSVIAIRTDPQATSISVMVGGKSQDVKNTKVNVNNAILSITGVTHLARSIEVTVIIPENVTLDYSIATHSGIMEISNLTCGSITVTANSCQTNISNVNASNLNIENDNGTVTVSKLYGGTHSLKSDFGVLTITEATGRELILESQFGKVIGRQLDYETITPIGGSGGVMDIQ